MNIPPEYQEPPRPEPDFHVYVDSAHYDAPIDVTHAVMDVYDIAINSMDFGSGFLSTEEVGNLRTLGKAIGAKHFDYQHDKCLRCGHIRNRHFTPHYGGKACAGAGFDPAQPDRRLPDGRVVAKLLQPICECTGYVTSVKDSCEAP